MINNGTDRVQHWERAHFQVSTDKTLLQIPKIHQFLSQQAYWSLGIPLEVVERSIQNSLCFGVYEKKNPDQLHQIGFARVITDKATFAYLADVYIESAFRSQGHSKWLMECIMNYPALKNLRRFCLATRDAHLLYKQFGFNPPQNPEYWMEIKDNEIYQRLKARS